MCEVFGSEAVGILWTFCCRFWTCILLQTNAGPLHLKRSLIWLLLFLLWTPGCPQSGSCPQSAALQLLTSAPDLARGSGYSRAGRWFCRQSLGVPSLVCHACFTVCHAFLITSDYNFKCWEKLILTFDTGVFFNSLFSQILPDITLASQCLCAFAHSSQCFPGTFLHLHKKLHNTHTGIIWGELQYLKLQYRA